MSRRPRAPRQHARARGFEARHDGCRRRAPHRRRGDGAGLADPERRGRYAGFARARRTSFPSGRPATSGSLLRHRPLPQRDPARARDGSGARRPDRRRTHRAPAARPRSASHGAGASPAAEHVTRRRLDAALYDGLAGRAASGYRRAVRGWSRREDTCSCGTRCASSPGERAASAARWRRGLPPRERAPSSWSIGTRPAHAPSPTRSGGSAWEPTSPARRTSAA